MDALTDWLNDNSGTVQAASTIVLALVTAVLVVVTGRYAKSTKEIAEATEVQVRSTRDIADATLRPVISLWIEPQGQGNFLAVYHNIGSGPALNLEFYLPGLDKTVKRVGMATTSPESRDISFGLAPSTSEHSIAVVYEDAARWRWKTELTLLPVPSKNSYENGPISVTKIGSVG